MVGKVQSDLDKIGQWCHRNKLKLSDTKCKVLLLGSINKLKNVDFFQSN